MLNTIDCNRQDIKPEVARFSKTSASITVVGLCLTMLISTGCAITPSSIVQQPTTAKTPVNPHAEANNGGIFNTASYRPMFEDRRPRFVGDILTINIIENTTATKANASDASKKGDASFNTDATLKDNVTVTGGLLSKLPFGNLTSFSASGSNSYEDDANANASNRFNGAITATVIEVLPNGNLLVSGEKQIGLDKGTEFVRFSGVVNPDTITQGNFVPSTKVADARIEYRTNSKIDGAQIASIFARFFLSMSPW